MDLGVHRATLSARLAAGGVQTRNKGMDKQVIDEARRRYEPGESLARIGEVLDVSARTIHPYLLERGLRRRSTTGRERPRQQPNVSGNNSGAPALQPNSHRQIFRTRLVATVRRLTLFKIHTWNF